MKLIIDGYIIETEMITHVNKFENGFKVNMVGPSSVEITRVYRRHIYLAPWNEGRLIQSEVTPEQWDKYMDDVNAWNAMDNKYREMERSDIDTMYESLLHYWNPNINEYIDISVNSYEKKHE